MRNSIAAMPVSCRLVVRWTVFLAVIGAAILIRVLDFPGRYDIRNMDETGYCQGSLQLLEGITPGYKAAPAGPLLWAGWIYLGAESAWDFVHPLPAERRESSELRPFTALNRVLFDNCRDISALHRALVVINVLLSIAGVAAAVGLGYRLGGAIAGALIGGLFGVTPVFVELSEMSRAYSMAWAFGMLSLYLASRGSDTVEDDAGGNAGNTSHLPGGRWTGCAIFLGLSIGSRIEMLCLIPLVWWVFCRHRQKRRWWIALAKLTLLSLCIATWVAPWLLTQLIGNLRTIATVRFAGANSLPWNLALWHLVYHQGMGPILLMALIGLGFQPRRSLLRVGLLAGYVLLLTISMMTGYADGIHQHGAVFIGWWILIAVVIGPMLSRWPRTTGISLILALVLPAVQTMLLMRSQRSLEDHEDSVAWIERHVAPATTVYLIEGGLRTLLPTPQASAVLWSEVTDDQAWQKKIQSGLSRFKLSADELPRALSEENLIQERGNRRKWFILGGRTDLPIPRYDVKVVVGSPVFGVRNGDLEAAMKSHGGLLVWRDGFHVDPPAFLGPPLKQWISKQGSGVRIYATPEARGKLK